MRRVEHAYMKTSRLDLRGYKSTSGYAIASYCKNSLPAATRDAVRRLVGAQPQNSSERAQGIKNSSTLMKEVVGIKAAPHIRHHGANDCM